MASHADSWSYIAQIFIADINPLVDGLSLNFVQLHVRLTLKEVSKIGVVRFWNRDLARGHWLHHFVILYLSENLAGRERVEKGLQEMKKGKKKLGIAAYGGFSGHLWPSSLKKIQQFCVTSSSVTDWYETSRTQNSPRGSLQYLMMMIWLGRQQHDPYEAVLIV